MPGFNGQSYAQVSGLKPRIWGVKKVNVYRHGLYTSFEKVLPGRWDLREKFEKWLKDGRAVHPVLGLPDEDYASEHSD